MMTSSFDMCCMVMRSDLVIQTPSLSSQRAEAAIFMSLGYISHFYLCVSAVDRWPVGGPSLSHKDS